MITREALSTLKELARQFRAVALVGPRQSGKSTIAKLAFPKKKYVTLEDPRNRESALSDIKGFLAQFPDGAIIDEAQRAPELFNYLQQILDESQDRGKFILTGSNNFLMLEKITQSLAGRIGYLDLLPFSLKELTQTPGFTSDLNNIIWRGGYPSVTFEGIDPKFWFPAYIRTYIERDVRQIRNVLDLDLFQKLLFLFAGRTAQQINLNSLSIECGVDRKTVQSWLSLMQTSYIVYLLQPYYKNFSKRIVKSAKLYFYDTGLASYLLGIQSSESLQHHAMRGPLFENLVINELLKNRFNKGLRSNLYYWRDVSGHEIDVVIDRGTDLTALEIKSGMTVNPDYFKNLTFWRKISGMKKTTAIYSGSEDVSRSDGMNVVSWKNINSISM